MSVCARKLLTKITSEPTFIPKLSVFRNMSVVSKTLLYKEYGEPLQVLQCLTDEVKIPEGNEVAVKWMLSPVNPADINTIQGKYPSKPALPAVPGNEGVGEIVALGSDVQNLKIGDRVIPNASNIGTWRTQGIYKSEDLMKISKGISTVDASMLNVNPCTAYRMLKDFVPLQSGDTVIQNGGNSAVGQLVIQLCKIWNYKNVSIVRDRPDISDLKSQLKEMGATEVLTEEQLRKTTLFKSNQLAQPKLALNCIGGQNGLEVLRQLGRGGVMVTYGGMSREPVTVPTSALIFKDITVKGFWMTAWNKKNLNSKERTEMYEELAKFFKDKKLHAPSYKIIPFSKYQEAIKNALNLNGKQGHKYILDLEVF